MYVRLRSDVDKLFVADRERFWYFGILVYFYLFIGYPDMRNLPTLSVTLSDHD